MDSKELLAAIKRSESSKVQFKERMPHHDSIAHEIITADETEIFDTNINNVDKWLFFGYFEKEFGMSYEEKGLTLDESY